MIFKAKYTYTYTFTPLQRVSRLLSSLAILTCGRMLLPIAPYVTEWNWAYDNYRTLTNHSIVNTTAIPGAGQLPQMTTKMLLVLIMYPISEMMVSPIAGTIGDKFGYYFAAVIGLIAGLFLNIILSLQSNFLALLCARCIQGISIAFLLPVGMARIMQVYPTDHRLHKMVLALALAMSTIVFSILESTIAGFVIKYLGVYAWFYVMIPINVSILMAIVLQFHPHVDPSKETDEEKDTIPKPPPTDISFYDIITDYQVMIATGGLALAFLTRVALEPSIGLWMSWKFNTGPVITGLIWGAGGMVLIPSFAIGSRFAQQYPDSIWLYALIHQLLCAAPTMFLPYSPSPLIVGLTVTFYLYCSSSVRYAITALFAIIAETKFQRAYGRVMAVANFGSTLPYVIGPLGAVIYPWMLIFLRKI